jgi:hypothetical protein
MSKKTVIFTGTALRTSYVYLTNVLVSLHRQPEPLPGIYQEAILKFQQ